MVPLNIEIIYRDDAPDLVSQSLTGRASRRLAPGAARVRKGHHEAHANDAAEAAAETLAAAEGRAKQARQKRAARGRKGRTHPRPALSHSEASARGRRSLAPAVSPLDRNAEVRAMMVARALTRHQEKGKGLRQDQREGAGGAHRAALALAQRRDRQVLPREAIAEAAAAPGARCTRRSAPLSRSASCPG